MELRACNANGFLTTDAWGRTPRFSSMAECYKYYATVVPDPKRPHIKPLIPSHVYWDDGRIEVLRP